MENQKFDGGPAFPADPHAVAGMTLRDYFAAKAMQAFCTTRDDFESSDQAAAAAYEMADSMLKARNA